MSAKAQEMPRLLSLKETVQRYGATLWFWRNQVWAGRLPVVRIGRKQFLDTHDIEQFIEQNKEAHKGVE